MRDKEAVWLTILVVVMFIAVYLLSPTIISRVDAQHTAEQEAIELHKQEIKQTSNKELAE